MAGGDEGAVEERCYRDDPAVGGFPVLDGELGRVDDEELISGRAYQ